jgi:hypothetical protein
LVYSATGNTVKDVFVAGEQVLKDGELVKIDHHALMLEVQDSAKRISSRLDMKKLNKLLWPIV